MLRFTHKKLLKGTGDITNRLDKDKRKSQLCIPVSHQLQKKRFDFQKQGMLKFFTFFENIFYKKGGVNFTQKRGFFSGNF